LTTTNLFANPGNTQAGSFAGGTASVSGGPTNWFGQPIGATAMPVTRETLRALLVLQNDLERLLPLLDTLNTGTNRTTISLTPGFVPAKFTNTFGGTTAF
ncbi:MAG TPA: hypothetical protein VNT26_03900, partial [Candidatus Sulfotelmatobacter sp.]|nr:hypothetical protein [Candidatus Sulfotelmatobacter sp.]